MGDFSWAYDDAAKLTGDNSYLKNKPVSEPATTTPTASGWWTPERINQAVNHLQQNAKLSPMGAKGLVARWSGVEARGGPNSVNPNSGAVGIGQWLGNRKNGVPSDFVGQLNHAVKELNTTESAAAKRLRTAQTPEDAATGASMFERAEGYDPKTGKDNFVGQTVNALKRFGGTTEAKPANDFSFVDQDVKDLLGDVKSPAPDYSYIQDDIKKLGLPVGSQPTNPTNVIAQPSTQGVVTPAVAQPVVNPAEANANAVASQVPVLNQIANASRQGLQYSQPKTPAEAKQAALIQNRTPKGVTSAPTISDQNYDEQGNPVDENGKIIPASNLSHVQVARENAGGTIADKIDIPENIKTESGANEYVKAYLRAKYPTGDFSKNKFLEGYHPGNGAAVSYDSLKAAGVDTDQLLNQKVAENRVENPTPDLSIKADLPAEDARNIKDFINNHSYIFGGLMGTEEAGNPLASAIGTAVNAGGNSAKAVAGAIRIIEGLNPARMDSMAEAAGVKPYRAGDDVVKYLQDVADTTSKLARSSQTDKEGIIPKIGSTFGEAVGGVADIPRLSLYPGGPVVAFGADSALQAAGDGENLDWNKVAEAGKKGAELGAATLLSGGIGKLALKAGASNALAKGIELGSVLPTIFTVSKAQGDTTEQAFKNAILFTAFHGQKVLSEAKGEPIRVRDERGNEAVIKIGDDGKVETLDPKTEAKAQIVIPEATYNDPKFQSSEGEDVPRGGIEQARNDAHKILQEKMGENADTVSAKHEEPRPFDEQFYVDDEGIIRDKKPDDKITEPTRTPEQVQDENDALYTKKKIEAKTKPIVSETPQSETQTASTPSTQGEVVTDKLGRTGTLETMPNGEVRLRTRPLREGETQIGGTTKYVPVEGETKGVVEKKPIAEQVQEPASQGRTVTVNDKSYTLTPEQEARWKKEVDEPLASAKRLYESSPKRGTTSKSGLRTTMEDKALKGEQMRLAAVKRDIVGAYTGKESANRAKKEASNYQGKPVSVEGQNGKVVGNSFGKVRVELENGSKISVDLDKVGKPVEKSANQQAIDVANTKAAKALEDAHKALRNSLNTAKSGGLDPEVLTAMVRYGRYKAEAGLRTSAEFAKHMVDEFGEKIRPHVDEIYNAIRDKYNFSGMDKPEQSTDTVSVKPETKQTITLKPEGAEPPTEPNAEPSPTEPEKGVSKIGKSIEAKAVEKGLSESFDTTTEYDKKTVANQKAKVAELVTDEERTSRIINGSEKLPADINPAMFIDGVERYADEIGGDKGLQMKYELANSDVIRKTSEAAQTLRFTQEREQDSAMEALRQVRKARAEQLKTVLGGRDIETAINEEAEKLAKTMKGAKDSAVKKASKRETWDNFIANLTC